MTLKKHTDEESSSANGLAPEAELIKKAQKLSEGLSLRMQGYLALAVGAFLLLFSLGYFAFFKLAIGSIGLALVAWGIYVSGLTTTITNWFGKLRKHS